MEYMESKMQDLIEGGINERDSLYAEIEVLRAQVDAHDTLMTRMANNCDAEVRRAAAALADCQAVIRHKGHDADCPTYACERCGDGPHVGLPYSTHDYRAGPCSDACGYERCTKESGK